MSLITPPLLVVIPARRRSRGVRAKNLQLLNGAPLVAHSIAKGIDLARWWQENTEMDALVVVTTDDPQVRSIARSMGVVVLDRPAHLADDDTPVAEAVAEAVLSAHAADWAVAVLQPTSPLVSMDTVLGATSYWLTEYHASDSSLHTVVPQLHHGWLTEPDGTTVPLYPNRVNRQELYPRLLTETGGVQLIHPGQVVVDDHTLVHASHQVYEIPAEEAIDVDTTADLAAARAVAHRRRILFVVEGTRATGSGHIHRALLLADQLAHHEITWAWADGSPDEWAQALAEELGIPDDHGRWEDLPDRELAGFDVVVFDRLATPPSDVAAARQYGCRVVSIEDDGPAAQMANVVVDEFAYGVPGVLGGPPLAVIRPEFLVPHAYTPDGPVVVSFGGTDPAHLNERVALALTATSDDPMDDGIGPVVVCAGPGAPLPVSTLGRYEWLSGTPLGDMLRRACLLVTSAGRTVHEAAALGVPVVSVPVNAREARHDCPEGVVRFPEYPITSPADIVRVVRLMVDDPDGLVERSATLAGVVDGRGAERLARVIESLALGL